MTDQLPHATVKHVIYLMLENRGFDHVMGWLYPPPVQGQAPHYHRVSFPGDQRPFMGLSKDALPGLSNPYPPALKLAPQPVIPGTRSPKTPSFNPGEHFPHIMNQMWGVGEDPDQWTDPAKRGPRLQTLMQAGPAPMNGYILDYARELEHLNIKDPTADQLSEIVETYLPEQLPVLCGLARSFAVSDEWYCSVPSQTNTNRAFSLTGTSRGMVNNGFYLPDTLNPSVVTIETFFESLNADSLPVSTGSLFELLQAAGYSWKVFWQSEWPPRTLTAGVSWQYTRTLIPSLLNAQFDSQFVKFDATRPGNELFTAIRLGNLPAVTYIEPKWGGGASWDAAKRLIGNEYHPVCDTTVAEDFLRSLYDVLAASPHADDTLLIITFDENGGTYDHMPPPDAPAPRNEAVPLPHAPKNKGLDTAIHVTKTAVTSDPMTRTQYGFDFKQFGVRVPTLLVSTQLRPQTVFRSTIPGKVLDHTSIIASILDMAGIDRGRWLLGDRVAEAPTFTHLFDDPAVPPNRPDKPFSFSGLRSNGVSAQADVPYRLAYIGSLWPAAGNPRYLGGAAAGALHYYPTLVDVTMAAPYRLMPLAPSASGAIRNMSRLRIVSDEPQLGAKNALRASWSNRHVFFGTPTVGEADGGTWEIRLLQSRDCQDVRIGDYVAFFSCLHPPAAGAMAELTTPDPLQRLMPHPSDGQYATTRAGQWALWQIQAL